MKDLQNLSELEISLADRSHKIHLYFFHQSHCQLCKSYKKNFFPKLAQKNDSRAVLSLVNADDDAVHAYCDSVNERDFVGFPFWMYYDSEKQKVLEAGASGIKDQVVKNLEDYINGVVKNRSYVAS